MKVYLFKFEAVYSKELAFVIHYDLEKAKYLLEQETLLEFRNLGSRFVDEIPAVNKFWHDTNKHIYLNNIPPF